MDDIASLCSRNLMVLANLYIPRLKNTCYFDWEGTCNRRAPEDGIIDYVVDFCAPSFSGQRDALRCHHQQFKET